MLQSVQIILTGVHRSVKIRLSQALWSVKIRLPGALQSVKIIIFTVRSATDSLLLTVRRALDSLLLTVRSPPDSLLLTSGGLRTVYYCLSKALRAVNKYNVRSAPVTQFHCLLTRVTVSYLLTYLVTRGLILAAGSQLKTVLNTN